MPIYEYICCQCGCQFENWQKITDSSIPPCEKCGANNVKRQISISNFVLKGSGWYSTDYQKKDTGEKKKALEKTNEKPAATKTSMEEPSSSPAKKEPSSASTKIQKSGEKST